MATTIKCDTCGSPVEITKAIQKELEEKLLQDIKKQFQDQIKKLEGDKIALKQKMTEDLEQEKIKIIDEERKRATEKIRKELHAKLEASSEAVEEQEKKNAELQNEVKELLKSTRELRDAKSKLEIEYEKKMLEEQEKIKNAAKKEAQDELNLEIAKKDKQLKDLEIKLKEAQYKAQQGSQQLQGEIQELELEEQLRNEFRFDEISDVPKGIRGADIIQKVTNASGNVCGTILWETKNTKSWSQQWVSKMNDDKRDLKADLAVIVSNTLPDGVVTCGHIDGVLVTSKESSIAIAHILRERLIQISTIKTANKGKANKAEIVYDYLISNEFKQRIEVWVEYFQNRKDEITKERIYFTKKWEREDQRINKVLQNTAGIYGDLQGLIGNALPKVSYLELPEDIDEQ